jgi:hypothetical protein
MQVIHRISLTSTKADRAELARMGVVIGDSTFTTFEVIESDPEWPRIHEWISRRKPADVISTRFSNTEIVAAEWLELVPDWHHGYPQPGEDTRGYLAATYDLKDYCECCGVGLEQIRPFQMRAEPRWGRRSILQLNWVFDEYFATPEAWKAVLQPFGVACQDVIGPGGASLKTVVQLRIPDQVPVDKHGLVAAQCAQCGRTKYLPVQRGPAPALLATPAADGAKTDVYFGSAAAADKRVLISRRLAGALREARLRGVSLKPVANRSGS